MEGAVNILNRHIYRDTGSPACDEETYVDLQYAAIIEAVKQAHRREVALQKMQRAYLDKMVRYNTANMTRLPQLASVNLESSDSDSDSSSEA